MSRVIFSITADQLDGLEALAAGERIESTRVQTSLEGKHLARTTADWRVIITANGRRALALLNHLHSERQK